MEPISDFIRPKRPPTQAQSERGFLLGYFHQNVNYERDGSRFKKLPIGAIAAKLKGLELPDLYYLQSICEDARRRGKSWGKVFWGSLKPRSD